MTLNPKLSLQLESFRLPNSGTQVWTSSIPIKSEGWLTKMTVVSSRTSNESSSNLFQLCTSKIHMQILNILLVNISVNGPYLCVGMYNPPPFSKRKQHTLSWPTAMNLSTAVHTKPTNWKVLKSALLNHTPPEALALSNLDKNQIAPFRSRKNSLIFQKKLLHSTFLKTLPYRPLRYI